MKLKLLLLFILFSFSFPNRTFAEEKSLGVYPPIIEIKANNEALVKTPITLVNGSENETEVSISLKGLNVKDGNSGSIDFYPETNTPDKLGSFLKSVQVLDEGVPIKSINLYPKESKVLHLSFPVTTTKPEEYYFSVVFSTVPETLPEGTSTSISAGVASLVFVSLNESENLKPELEEFSTDFFHTSSPVKFNIKATNTGDHFKNISGIVYIYNMFGKEAAKIEIPQQIMTASSTRSLRLAGRKELGWKEKFPFGVYTAKAIIAYENSPTIEKEKRFVVLPLIPLLIITATLFFILGVMLRVIRKINLKEK